MLVERVIFFEGQVYQIEEEIYSDSDHSSVYTSEDSFEEDDKLQSMFKQQIVLHDRTRTPSSALNSRTSNTGSPERNVEKGLRYLGQVGKGLKD